MDQVDALRRDLFSKDYKIIAKLKLILAEVAAIRDTRVIEFY